VKGTRRSVLKSGSADFFDKDFPPITGRETMATKSPTDNDTADKNAKEKSDAEKAFPNPREMLGLMVSCQRLGQQVLWQMCEAMGDMMEMPLKRDQSGDKKSDPINRTMSDVKDAIDSATQKLQQGGRPR
jgi:hypothetical protein